MAKFDARNSAIYLKAGSILLSGVLISLSIYYAGQGGFDFVRDNNNIADSDGENTKGDCTGDTRLDEECFPKYAESLGLNGDEFKKCVVDKKHNEIIDREISAGEKYGVQGTPSFYIGKGKGDEFQGFYVGSVNIDDIESLIERLEKSSIEETHTYWVDSLEESLKAVEPQVREYYASTDGGSLTGRALEDAVNEFIETQRSRIKTDYIIQTFNTGDGVVSGDGEIVMMEFSDYQCPYCKEFANNVLVQSKEKFVDSGRARFIFRDFPLEQIHPRARDAANAARCAGDQGKYFEFHNLLFEIN